ncbi:MAG: hypothetical protein AAF653_11595 [Chloroflexota bacterium]
MKPGISRATVGTLLGFAVGAAIVTGLRAAFGFTPYWNLSLVLVLGVFMSAYGTIWGIGGFNPKMSEHPDDSAPVLTEDELAEQAGWRGMLSSTTWRVTGLTLLLVFGLIVIALVPGFGLNVTSDAGSSVKLFGTVNLEVGEEVVPINQAWLLIGFTLFTMLSLAITGAVLAGVFHVLSRGTTNAYNTEAPVVGAPRDDAPQFMRRVGDIAGTLAERIAPDEDKDTTAVVVKKES